jgi:hypothetical protein
MMVTEVMVFRKRGGEVIGTEKIQWDLAAQQRLCIGSHPELEAQLVMST